MPTDALDPLTLQFYAKEAPVYTGSGKNGVSRHLQTFLEYLPKGAKVLELGCGGGRDAEAMLAAGFDVTPTDGIPEIAAQAEKRLKRPVQIMRFDELNATEEFDAVWANASLLHVPKAALADILRLIHKALVPNGLLFASYKAGEAEGRDRHGRYFNYPSRAELVETYHSSAAWETVSVVEHMGGGYDPGVLGKWIATTYRKSE